MPENQDALELWNEVKTQWRTNLIGIIGLDYGEVRRSARDLGIVYATSIRKKIQALEDLILKKQGKKEKGSRRDA